MNHATVVIGSQTSVASRFGTNSTITRPEKLLDVLCFNNTGGTLYMQVHELAAGTNTSSPPADGVVPMFSFPVIGGLGGTLGRSVDMTGIYCCWSSTQATKTIAAASGSINIIIKG